MSVTMKRYFAVILLFSMMVLLCSCGGQKAVDSSGTDASESSTLEVDEGLLNVEITMPASFFEDSSEEEILAAANENGIKKCTINEDKSVTYEMSKATHKEVMDGLKTELENSIDALVNGEEAAASFRKIEYTNDFSEFNVYVDRDTYTSWDSLYVFAFYISGAYYQAFDGKDMDDIDVVVNFIDEETSEIIESSSYREMADNMENSENAS